MRTLGTSTNSTETLQSPPLSSLTDCLRRKASAEIITNARVTAVRPGYEVIVGEAVLSAPRVVLCTGGKAGAQFVIVLGERELAEGAAQVKDMRNSASECVKLEELADYIQRRL